MVINELGYLVEPNNQIVLPNGSTNVAGIVRVYNAGTDDIAKTYCDFNGTRNPANIRLDNNGRAVIIADVTKAYRVDVLDSNGGLLWTVEPAYCIGGEGGGGGGISPAVLIATAEIIEGNDNALSQSFSFSESKKLGDDIYIQEGSVKCDAGVYHVDFTISIAINQTTPPRPWVENVSIDYGVGFAYINLDRSNMDPTASDSVDVGYDIVVDTDGTTLPVTLIGLGTNCYATMQHFNVHKVAEAE
jgi:hypothetical protein